MCFDVVDIVIFNQFQMDGCLINVELVECVGFLFLVCYCCVKVLEVSGVIDCYVVILLLEVLGCGIMVYVQVMFDNQKCDMLQGFEDVVEDVFEVMECYLMSGEVDYLVWVLVCDVNDYECVYCEVLLVLLGVVCLYFSFIICQVFLCMQVLVVEGMEVQLWCVDFFCFVQS